MFNCFTGYGLVTSKQLACEMTILSIRNDKHINNWLIHFHPFLVEVIDHIKNH